MIDPTQPVVATADFLIDAYADAIKGLGTVPSGHLYAATMVQGVTLIMHQSILTILINRGQIFVSGQHLITWIGK